MSHSIGNTVFTFKASLYANKQRVSADGNVSLYLLIYISRPGKAEHHPMPLRLRWPLDKIDFKGNRVKPRDRNDADANDYNLIILTELHKLNEVAKRFRLVGKVINMKAFLREFKVVDYSKNLIGYMMHMRNERYRERDIQYQTYKNHGSTIESIIQFCAKKNYNSYFDGIDKKWMSRYKTWLLDEGKEIGTVWTRLRDVKSYLQLAKKEKTIYVDDEAMLFPNPEPETHTTFLEPEEIRRMMILYDERFLTPVQQNVLKGFLFTCFTSLRISDLYVAGNEWVVSDSYLRFMPKKGNRKSPKVLQIPLIPLAKSFIDVTLKKFFDLPSTVEYNRTLKDLARMAEIGKDLHSHVGRHTFGFLYMENVGDIYGLQKIMGHKKIETTMRYAHISQQYKLRQAIKIQAGFEDGLGGGLLRSSGIKNDGVLNQYK